MKKLMRVDNARVAEQKAQMEEIVQRGICPFCREHFKENHGAPIVWESRHWLITSNDYPYDGTRVHLLIVSKKHIEHLTEISFKAAVNLMRALRWASAHYTIRGGSFLMRFGDMRYTGATIAHLHAHVVVGVREGKNTESIKVKLGHKKIKGPTK